MENMVARRNPRIQKKRKIITPRGLDRRYLGEEPVLTGSEPESAVIAAFSWYNYFYSSDADQQREWLTDYLTSVGRANDAVKLNDLEDWRINSSAAYLSRMALNGFIIDDDRAARYNENIRRMILSALEFPKKKVVDDPTESKPVPRRQQSQTGKYLAELDSKFDAFLADMRLEFSAYEWLRKNNVARQHCAAIVAYFMPQLAEIDAAISRSDPQVVEGYRTYAKNDIRKLSTFVASIIDDVGRWDGNQKKQRQPRKKKQISADKLASKLRFKKEDPVAKIVSVDPVRIISAEKLWLYDTAAHVMTLFVSSTGGLSIKGSKIIQYDEKMSFRKKLRKPEELLTAIASGQHRFAERYLSDLKTTSYSANPRVNDRCVLLGVVRS